METDIEHYRFSLSLYVMCVRLRRAMSFMMLQKMDRFAMVLPDLIEFTGFLCVLVFKNSVVCAIMHGIFEKSCNLDVHVFTATQVLHYKVAISIILSHKNLLIFLYKGYFFPPMPISLRPNKKYVWFW